MNAFASMHRAGVALAFGSDSPVTPFDPWAAVRAAAWHHTETERIAVPAAFDAHTRGGWRAARRDEGGVIALGAPGEHRRLGRAGARCTDADGVTPAARPRRPDVELPACVLTLVAGGDSIRRDRSTGMNPRQARPRPGHRPQGPQPGAPGRPADRQPGQEAHDRLGRARDAAARRSPGRRPRRHPVGQPPAGRRPRRRRPRARHRRCRSGTRWSAARPTTCPRWPRRRPPARCGSGCPRAAT